MREANIPPELVLQPAEHVLLQHAELRSEARRAQPADTVEDARPGPRDKPRPPDTAGTGTIQGKDEDPWRQHWRMRRDALEQRNTDAGIDWADIEKRHRNISTSADADERYRQLANLLSPAEAVLSASNPTQETILDEVRMAHVYERQRLEDIAREIGGLETRTAAERRVRARLLLEDRPTRVRLNPRQRSILTSQSRADAPDSAEIEPGQQLRQ